MDSSAEIQKLCEQIVHDFRPERITLFGSHAYGTPTLDSDVDLLVVMSFEGRHTQQAVKIRSRLQTSVPLDLLVRTPEQLSERLAMGDFLSVRLCSGLLNNTLHRVVSDLDRHGISYNVIGAVALNQHGYRRFTEDINLLLTKEGLSDFQDKLVGSGYQLLFEEAKFEGAKKRFRTTEENVTIEIITTGEYPGDGLPKPIVFHNPEDYYVVIDGIKTVSLEKLVELKLASGTSAPDRLKDLADVQELIKAKQLGIDFAEALDSSVQSKFIELYQGVAQAKERGTLTG